MEEKDYKSEQIFSFCDPHIFRFFVNHMPLMVLFVWMILLLWEIFFGYSFHLSDVNPRFPSIAIKFIFPIIFVPWVLFYIVNSRIAQSVVFDMRKGTVEIKQYFRKKSNIYPLDDIESIKFRWRHYFIMKKGKRKIFINSKVDFICFVQENDLPREWGSVAKYFYKNEFAKEKGLREVR